MRLLDAGAGGPAAWAAERFGGRPILLEPMPAADQITVRLIHAVSRPPEHPPTPRMEET